MKGEVITDAAGVAGIAAEWRRLAELRGNAFLTPEWFGAWWAHAEDRHDPLVLAARRDGGELAGVIPLALDGTRRPRAISFAASPLGDRFGIAARAEDEVEVAEAAMRALDGHGAPLIILHRIDLDSAWPEAMAAASGRRLAVVEQGRAELPHVSVAGLDWEGYVAGRSQKFRQRVARGLERALERKGIGFAVRETGAMDDLDKDLGTLFELHDRRREEGVSSVADPRVRSLLRYFAESALGHGWLRLRILEIEGSPAAAYLAWRLGSRYSVYQSGFDPAFAQHSAGMLLLNDTVRSAIGEEGVDDVDLMLGGEGYKWRFAPEAREVRSVVLVGAWRPARLLVSGEAMARRRGRALGRRPGVGGVLQRLGRLLPTGRSG
jgi:CelD/BcsL family acetyltransferase involved in cellulose biosynthesis